MFVKLVFIPNSRYLIKDSDLLFVPPCQRAKFFCLVAACAALSLKFNHNIITPLGVNLHTARRLACRKEVARNSSEIAPLVGYLDVLHGGDYIARVRVHHLYGDVDERFLAVGQHEVRAHLSVHFCVISLGHGRHGGVMYARVERIVRLARGHVEARGEEALVGDAHLQVLDGREIFALTYQVVVSFHVSGDKAVLGERTLKRNRNPLNSPPVGELGMLNAVVA